MVLEGLLKRLVDDVDLVYTYLHVFVIGVFAFDELKCVCSLPVCGCYLGGISILCMWVWGHVFCCICAHGPLMLIQAILFVTDRGRWGIRGCCGLL